MPTKIAVIGSKDFIDHLVKIIPQIENVEIEPYIYTEPSQATKLIQQLKPCDIVFFSGALPYYFSKEIHEQLPIPCIYLEQDESVIATSLLSIIYHQNIHVDRISIDLMRSSFVANVLRDIGIFRSPQHVIDYEDMLPNEFDITQIIQYHHSRYELGLIDIALTSIHAVYDQLQKLGVPTEKMIDPTHSLVKGLERAKTLAEYTNSRSTAIAVVSVSLLVPANSQINALHNLAHAIHSTLQEITQTNFLLYSTRGDIESFMANDAFSDFIANFMEPVSIGFGYGTTIMEAEQNAIIARSFAENHANSSTGFILTESKELLGPFPKGNKVYRLKNDHPALLQIAKEMKLSPANLSKIIQFSRSRQHLQFTAADLSEYLQITRRSTERIIKKLVDHGSAKIVGEEMTYQQGRPRAIYELTLPIYYL